MSDKNSISSPQIGFNVALKDFKYKTSEQRFQNAPLSSRITLIIIQHIDTLPKYGQKTLDVRSRST